jgi:hypothetical protein
MAMVVSKVNVTSTVVESKTDYSDLGYQLLSPTQLNNDRKSAMVNGAAGFVVFRYGPGKYVSYQVAKLYKKVRYRKWVKKWIKVSRHKYKRVKVRRAYCKRVLKTKLLYKYYKYGKWDLT